MKEIGRDLNKKMTSLDAIIWNVDLGGLPCAHITWRLSNILNRWVKKLLKKMITLLFVLFGLLTIRAFWMKDKFSSISTKLEHYIYVVDAINHMYICMGQRI